MPADLDGLLWLLILLGPLLLLQRSLHRETQAILLLITRRVDIALSMFSLLFFPGVLLHEGSHFLMARILGVRTGRFSLVPRPMENGDLQMGFVETESTDWLRDTLIGAAPLLTGGLFVAYAGLNRLGLLDLYGELSTGGLRNTLNALPAFYSQPDFWLWLYLALAVSSTMLPSTSDRRAWMPLGMTITLLLVIGVLAGAGPWLLSKFSDPINRIFKAVAVVFGISVLIHLILFPPIWMIRKLMSWITGMDVV